jgi:hypothetical protein
VIQYKYGKGDGNMTRKLTNKEFLKRLKECNPDAVPMEEYNGLKVKIKVMFKSCGHVDYKAPSKLFRGQRCGQRDCYNKRISEGRLVKPSKRNVEKLENIGIRLLEPYKGTKEKTKVKNLNCNHEYEVALGNVLKSGSGCPLVTVIKILKASFKRLKRNMAINTQLLASI